MKNIFAIAGLLIASLVIAQPVHNFYQGTDYSTIQDAINAANPYDIILVDAGHYLLTSTITIDKPLDLRGAQYGIDPRPLIGSARTAGSVSESILDGQGIVARILDILADDVKIEGFEIKSGTGDMIYSPPEDVQDKIRILNNIIHDAQGDEGIQLKSAYSAVIANNYIYNTVGDGINISDGGLGNEILCNELHDIHSVNAAIYCYGSIITDIEGNYIDGTTNNDGIKMGSSDGSDADYAPGGAITDNIIANTAQDGITVYQGATDVRCNEIYNSTSENGAIYVGFSPSDVSIWGNQVHDCGPGIGGTTTYAIRIGKDSGNPTSSIIQNNNLVNNQANAYDQTSGQSVWEHNYYDDYLSNPGYPANYAIAGGTNIDDSYETSPYPFDYFCNTDDAPGSCDFCETQNVSFAASSCIGRSYCIQLCEGQDTRISVSEVHLGQYPALTIQYGCSEPCNYPCEPATYVDEEEWDIVELFDLLDFSKDITGDGCVCITLDGILPVELTGFDAIPGNRSITLRWQTASETDNDHFDITRHGTIVGRVNADGSSSGASYEWTESNLTNGTEYTYTVSSVDIWGGVEELFTISATPIFNSAAVTEYALHQNYPNPFNPDTKIVFDLAESGFVSLQVYNILGQQIATLVNTTMESGRHTITFDASGLPSGLYLYRMEAGDFMSQKKMVLLK